MAKFKPKGKHVHKGKNKRPVINKDADGRGKNRDKFVSDRSEKTKFKKNMKPMKENKRQPHFSEQNELNNNKPRKSKSHWRKQKTEVEDDEGSDFEEVSERATKPTPTVESESGSEESWDEDQSDMRDLVKQQNRKKKKSGGFQSMGLSHNVFKGVTRKGYKIPTPIQRKTVPVIMEGKDVVAMARTGSGKTAAFLIPMFESLQTHSAKSGARALIMSPTRELALQTLKFAKELGKYTGLRAAVVLGGDRMEDQFAALHANPDIIIATPGRFMHVAVEMNLKLKSVQYVVFDEADRLFEMGFQEQLNEIIGRLPESRQTLLFSATLPKLLVEFAKAGLHDPVLIRLDLDTKLSEQLKLSFVQCRADDKVAVLLHLLKHVIPAGEQTVVFAATKHHVEYLNMILQQAEISCTYIYSSLDPTARKISLAKFQHAKVAVMIVTDLAARGIDIPLLDNVVNFHFPAKAKLFVHRVGRVARAGRSGVAYSLVSPDELAYVYDLHVFLGRPVKYVELGKPIQDGDGLFGRVPQAVMDDMAETLISWHKEIYDITAMIKVCKNAYSHYLRSRPVPAPDSIKRIKEMENVGMKIGIHPMFGSSENSQEAERVKLLDALKSYKANTTIFEINSTAKNTSFSIMKKKRDFHEKVVACKQRKMEEYQEEQGTGGGVEEAGATIATPTGGRKQHASDKDLQDAFSVVIGGKKDGNGQPEDTLQSKSRKKKKNSEENVRDEENYISYRPADYQSEQGLRLGSSFDREASTVVMDIGGDDEKITRKVNNAVKWDRKRKKFVRESNDDPKKKKIRTESGAWIQASYKSNAYKDWVRRSKVDTGVEQDDDDLGGVPVSSGGRTGGHSGGGGGPNRLMVMGGGDFRRLHRKGGENEPGAGAKRNKFKKGRGSELKRPEQIMKARKQRAKKEAFQKGRQLKHSSSRVKGAKHKA